jgi:hypothetical protein
MYARLHSISIALRCSAVSDFRVMWLRICVSRATAYLNRAVIVLSQRPVRGSC